MCQICNKPITLSGCGGSCGGNCGSNGNCNDHGKCDCGDDCSCVKNVYDINGNRHEIGNINCQACENHGGGDWCTKCKGGVLHYWFEFMPDGSVKRRLACDKCQVTEDYLDWSKK